MERCNFGVFLIICLLLFPIRVAAAGCDYRQLSKLKKYAGNIHYDYDYTEQNNTVKFSIRFTNVSEHVILQDLSTGQTYTNTNEMVINGLDAGKTYSFMVKASTVPASVFTYTEYTNGTWVEKEYTSVYADDCANVELKRIYVTLPTYNPYYNLPVCDGLDGYDLCFKWYKHELSKEEFEREVMDYKNKQIISDTKEKENKITLLEQIVLLYTKYYYIPLLLIIIVCSFFIYKQIKKEKSDRW